MGAKVWQNRRQNGPKSKTKTKTNTDTFQDRLKAILGPSWADLGTHLGSKNCVSPQVFQCFLKIHLFEKVRCQEATWAEVEPKWSPRGSQDRAQEGAKTSPSGSQDGAENEKKNEVNLGRVSVSLGRVGVSPRVLLRVRWGSKGRPRRPKTVPRPT